VIFFILNILMKLYNFEKEENNWDEREEGLPTHFVERLCSENEI